MKNILLTGGAGYIGSHVAHVLIDKGYKVTVIDSLITGNKHLVPSKAKLEICDIAEVNKISEIIQNNKEIVLMDKATGNLYEGDVARRTANIPKNDDKKRLKPSDFPKYRVFIQSTSLTRILLKDQGFLYEVSL
mgnify:CR=1 FL=1